KCMNPSSKVHYVPSKRHVNAKKEDAQKRPQRSTIKRAEPKKIWVPKSIIKEMHSQASKEKEKSKAIWIPNSHLKDLNIKYFKVDIQASKGFPSIFFQKYI
ncbi:hypothetical protein, partial [Klebsiella pneumoniae]|uniref:hypothetical protein n=1 Tax=Klebsiella pneumoniae TaxID=573 RepID=UPI0035324F3C